MKRIIVFTVFLMSLFTASKATIIIIIDDGLVPGRVYQGGVASNIDCSEDGLTGVGKCHRNAGITFQNVCPGWADIKAKCPNAIVINIDIDNEVNQFVSEIFDNYIARGYLDGTQTRTFRNVNTGQTFYVKVDWERLADGKIKLTINDHL